MWSYYGAKTNIVHVYPRPVHGRIIEPFAGTARYSLRHFESEVILCDAYDVIIRIWHYLQQASPGDILALLRHDPKAGDNINSFSYSCQAERELMGFLVGFGFTNPRQTSTPRLRNRPNAFNFTVRSIASQLFKIRHWTIHQGSYNDLSNQTATWFVDPPYLVGGRHYRVHQIDYNHLAGWCQERRGQVIVCENHHASWLPFFPLVTQNVLTGKHREVMWTNCAVNKPAEQLGLFL